jgi:hypothetical protein
VIAGCYDLRLECDVDDCAAGAFGLRAVAEWNLELGSACRAAARKAGWRWDPETGLCRCPSCVELGAKATP